MKANAPERIWIDLASDLPKLSGYVDKDSVEYIRKDAFIEKAVEGRVQPQNNSITDEELEQAKNDAYNDALDKIEYHSGEPTFADGWNAAIDCIKKKSFKPNLQWKPSDDQMEYLAKAITTLGDEGNCKTASILNDLRVELKKLRGE